MIDTSLYNNAYKTLYIASMTDEALFTERKDQDKEYVQMFYDLPELSAKHFLFSELQ